MTFNANSAPSGGDMGEPLGSVRPPKPNQRFSWKEARDDGYIYMGLNFRRGKWEERWVSPEKINERIAKQARNQARYRSRNVEKCRKAVSQWGKKNNKVRRSHKVKHYARRTIQPSVYICSEDGGTSVKIGVTKNMGRLEKLQCGNPRRLSFEHLRPFITAAEAFGAEQYLHQQFKSKRLVGEWFAVSVSEARAALDSLTHEHLPKEPLL